MVLQITEPYYIPGIRRLHATLSNQTEFIPDQSLLMALTKSDDFCSRRDMGQMLRTLLGQVVLPEKGTPSRPSKEIIINTDQGAGHKDSDISVFRIGEWSCPCPNRQWKEFVQRACQILYYEHEDEFEEWWPRIRGGHGSYYFSKRHEDLRDPRFVGGGIYVETNLNADNSVALIRKLCKMFGYNGSPLIP